MCTTMHHNYNPMMCSPPAPKGARSLCAIDKDRSIFFGTIKSLSCMFKDHHHPKDARWEQQNRGNHCGLPKRSRTTPIFQREVESQAAVTHVHEPSNLRDAAMPFLLVDSCFFFGWNKGCRPHAFIVHGSFVTPPKKEETGVKFSFSWAKRPSNVVFALPPRVPVRSSDELGRRRVDREGSEAFRHALVIGGLTVHSQIAPFYTW